MGRIRGKRNRDQDRYWHERRKASQSGMVAAGDVSTCSECGRLWPALAQVHGWCESCVIAWKSTADPVMLAQAASGYSPAQCLPAPSETDVDRILKAIAEHKEDKEFLPLLLFLGRGNIGRMQALWNFCKTMEVLELKTTSEVLRLSKASHDMVHRCGLHAPVQRSTLTGFFCRVLQAEGFEPLQRDSHLREYMRWFAESNRLVLAPLTRISSIAEWKTTRQWRAFPKLKFKPMTEHWPFLQKEAARDHLDIMLVDSLVPKGIPEQWRQDMCQDLFVAVLNGELDPDELRNGARHYIKKVWNQHPFKYGQLSLSNIVGPEKMEMLDFIRDMSFENISCEHRFEIHDPEPAGLATLGDVLRDKNNGIALPDLKVKHPDMMDEDVFEVYKSEVGRGRRSKDDWSTHGISKT